MKSPPYRIAASILFLALSLLLCQGAFAESQMEMNAKTLEELQKAEAKMDAVYQKLLSASASDDRYCSDLKMAQSAWQKYVEFHMKTLFPMKEGEDLSVVYGSIYPSEFNIAMKELTEQRIAELEKLAE